MLCLFSNAIAQNSRDTIQASSIINVNYLELVGGELRITKEKPIKHNMSWEYGGGIIYFYTGFQMVNYWFIDLPDVDNPFGPFWLGGLELRNGLRIYLQNNKNHEGLYFHINGFYKYAFHYDNSYSFHLNNLGINFLFGYKPNPLEPLSIDSYFGLGGRLIYRSDENYDRGLDKLFTPQFGFTVGYKLGKK